MSIIFSISRMNSRLKTMNESKLRSNNMKRRKSIMKRRDKITLRNKKRKSKRYVNILPSTYLSPTKEGELI
jgi:hypothetical protein